ncbi:toll/interleukin-1 receptor domain-containing protein [Priestia megaterium]|uniref:toll/interleukin-1 receptor domain-containing protein n=1 Tax=Priestia megaterium TaxID=1404 RepID=UPI0036DC801C
MKKEYDVFISHSAKDKLIANAVCLNLENRNIKCWIAPRDVAPGVLWGEEIANAIKNSYVFIIILSSNANTSSEVAKEVNLGRKYCNQTIPFRIEDVLPIGSLEYNLSDLHWLDALTEPREQQIETLINKVVKFLPDKKIKLSEANETIKDDELARKEQELINYQKTVEDTLIRENIEDGKSLNKSIAIKSTNDSEEEKEKQDKVLLAAENMLFLHKVDKLNLWLSFLYSIIWYIGKQFNLPNFVSINFSTTLFLITLSLSTFFGKASSSYYILSLYSATAYALICGEMAYTFIVPFVKGWPWLLSYLHFITIPLLSSLTFIIVFFERGDNMFLTRFATGSLVGFWAVKIYLFYQTKNIVSTLSYSVQNTISHYGWIIVILGFAFISFNRVPKLLTKNKL